MLFKVKYFHFTTIVLQIVKKVTSNDQASELREINFVVAHRLILKPFLFPM